MYRSDALQSDCARLGVAPYQGQALAQLLDRIDLKEKRVLEVGGSNLPRELLFDAIGAREWVSIDIIAEGSYQLLQQSAHYKREGIEPLSKGASMLGKRQYLILDGAIENARDLPTGYFDVILSITSFEHILALASALAQMKRLLAPSGWIFTYHGPIWSSYCGHHIWVDDEINFNVEGAIPDFGHLLHSPPAMFNLLRRTYGDLRAERAVLQIYHQPRINRLFYEDYLTYFELAGFKKINAAPYARKEVSPELQRRLEAHHSGYHIFDAYGMSAFLQ
ncbi:MAG: methyltransferase domain-containing protein [Proteobacteria bacterium]|nr:methyltransferase domain-containing protein [Pseudomonadota bacterium]